MAQLSRCRGCGKSIEWIEFDGKRIPLDPRPPTYQWIDDGSRGRWAKSSAMVSHFATCPMANDFSASRNSEPQFNFDDR